MNASVEISHIANLTASVEIVSCKRDDYFELMEFEAASVVFFLPRNRVNVGHLLSLTGNIRINDSAFPFSATGKIVWVEEEVVENLVAVKIHLGQYDRILWERYLQASNSQQGLVDTLMAAIRGDE
jgi:hypothetical protein